MYAIDNEPHEIGNGDLCVRTEKGTLVALVYARAPPPEPNWKIAHTIVKALNEAAQSQGSAAAGPHSSSLSTGL
jgi:hypothetical protein